jgi:hypothetical protein
MIKKFIDNIAKFWASWRINQIPKNPEKYKEYGYGTVPMAFEHSLDLFYSGMHKIYAGIYIIVSMSALFGILNLYKLHWFVLETKYIAIATITTAIVVIIDLYTYKD